MKKPLLLFLFTIITIHVLKSQDYIPFPTDYGKWNTLLHSSNGTAEGVSNYTYTLEGDTTLNSKSYKKVFCQQENEGVLYFGGLREDSLKNIYFFPKHAGTGEFIEFPSDTMEHLLYTFDSLYIGKVLPINSNNFTFSVEGIDSILIGNTYRKRYEISRYSISGGYWAGGSRWIEGIGSEKELFFPFAYEFEWMFFTLCFTDTINYQITGYAPGNSIFVGDSCHVEIPVGINDVKTKSFSSYPNPVENELIIKYNTTFTNASVSIYNIQGQHIQTKKLDHEESKLDVSFLNKGIYILELIVDSKIENKKIVKK